MAEILELPTLLNCSGIGRHYCKKCDIKLCVKIVASCTRLAPVHPGLHVCGLIIRAAFSTAIEDGWSHQEKVIEGASKVILREML